MLYEYWFASLKPLTDRKKKKLRKACKSAEEIYYIEESRLRSYPFLNEKDRAVIAGRESRRRAETDYRQMQKKEIRFLPYFHENYPQKLKVLEDCPYALYVKGRLPHEDAGNGGVPGVELTEKIPSVAIVGARQCTHYGETMALEYGEILAAAGAEIISGMARGIDGAGQRGALNGGGRTYAVLGSGVDVCYPREHTGLYTDILKTGGILSEQCPGEPPLPVYFPRRNRIISALSDVILVMEAREKSGSLITVDFGLEQGKEIYVLPGPADSPLSRGCHKLIRQGAQVLLSPQELLEELSVQIVKSSYKNVKNKKELETCEKLVYSCLDLFPKGVGELLQETDLRPERLMQTLATLEIKGFIREVSKNYYVKVRK